MSLLLPSFLKVRVYSPLLLDASRTRNVPSGVSVILSLTSSLETNRKEKIRTLSTITRTLLKPLQTPTYLEIWPQYHSASSRDTISSALFSVSCSARGVPGDGNPGVPGPGPGRDIFLGGSAGALANSGSFSPHDPYRRSNSVILMCASAL